jgi:hypothetical protein
LLSNEWKSCFAGRWYILTIGSFYKGDISMKTFSIVTRPDARSQKLAEGVRNALLTCGFREEKKHPDGVIVIGGDGTFLFAVHQYMDILKETVFIGIHSGTLGFYMDYRDTEISEFLTDIIPGNLPVEEYPILEAQVGVQTFYAVNEIRIENPMRIQNLNLYRIMYLLNNFVEPDYVSVPSLGVQLLIVHWVGRYYRRDCPFLRLPKWQVSTIVSFTHWGRRL